MYYDRYPKSVYLSWSRRDKVLTTKVAIIKMYNKKGGSRQ